MFKDRHEAGKKLALRLEKYRKGSGVIVLGLPRGGVVVAFEVARALDLPLDIIVPRKISAPGNPEFAIGAIIGDESGSGEQDVFDEQIINSYGISQEFIDREIVRERKEALRRLRLYRGNRPSLIIKNKTIILIDDGIATGATMIAAARFVKFKGAKKVIAAAPVAAPDSLVKIKKEVDETVCLEAPEFFSAVGQFYEVFEQTSDEEVVKLMSDIDIRVTSID